MFWTDWGDLKPGIYRSNMDGSSIYHLVSEDVKWPNGISVDEQWIYWTDAYLDCIERITFGGQQRSVILDNLPHPYAIAVFKVSTHWLAGTEKAVRAGGKHTEVKTSCLWVFAKMLVQLVENGLISACEIELSFRPYGGMPDRGARGPGCSVFIFQRVKG